MPHSITQADCITLSNRPRIYVGYGKGRLREVFRSATEPTEATHGDKYFASMGPFRTLRGAKADVNFGGCGNPHIRCVTDAERIGKKYADQLKNMPTRKVDPIP